MNIFIVKSRNELVQDDIFRTVISLVSKNWLVITQSKKSKYHTIEHGKHINLDQYNAIWIDEWPGLYSREEFWFDLFSRERLIVFTQKFDFSLEKKFASRWNLTWEYLVNEKLYPCYFSRHLKVVKEYCFAHPHLKFYPIDFSLNSMPYLELEEGGEGPAFYASEASWNGSPRLWLNGRHRPREVIISLSENKNRRHSYSKDALSRQAYYWRTLAQVRKNCVGFILWWTRWWQEAKELNFRAWLPHWSRISSQ